MPAKCEGGCNKFVASKGAFCKPCAIQRAGSGATREQIRALTDPEGKRKAKNARNDAIYKEDGRRQEANARNNPRHNGTEKHRESNRQCKERAVLRELEMAPVERPLADLLLERTADVRRLVASDPTLHRLVQSPEDVAACDTGCGTHP